MGQRVNIQYSVDIEELEGEVDRLLSKAHERIEKLSFKIDKDSPAVSMQSVDLIENLRLEMAQIDYSLSDLNKIITGYLSYRVADKDGSEASEHSQIPQSDVLDELQAALLQAKENNYETLDHALDNFKKNAEHGKKNNISEHSS